MRPDMLRLIRAILQHSECYNFMEKALLIFLHVVRFSEDAIPPECWEMLSLLFQSVDSGVGVDFFVNIEEVLDNLVSGATLEFLTNGPIMEATFLACQKMLIGGVVCVPECKIAAAQMIEALFHQAKGCTAHPGLLDAHLPHFVDLLLQSLVHSDLQETLDPQLRIWIVAAMMDCFYYNPRLAFEALVRANAHEAFFRGFFYLFRGCIPELSPLAPFQAARGTKKVAKPRKVYPDATEAAEVVELLSILTRKVLILGLTSLMGFVGGYAGGGAPPDGEGLALAARVFLEQHLLKAVGLAQYCIFRNQGIYTKRCQVSERNLHDIRTGADPKKDDDVDVDDDDLLDLNAASDDDEDDEGGMDDFQAIDDNDEDDDDDDDDFGVSVDEGDDYESPIDEINEVQFFLQWLGHFLHQDVALRASVLPILKAENEYTNAEQTAQRYRQLCKELDAAMREDIQRRQRQAAG
ncbi:unnamed protein product [Phytomonas sp. Hart1]|nr:unnamed protein product [Phytomonas sp. Hart1]|eukprot:CCW67312.1 unnamed protein product [Phytomonas sp. isolate Hart1]